MKPATYVEWRELYQEECKMAGVVAAMRFRRGVPVMGRCLYEILRRIDRIQNHLDETRYDDSWCAALWQLVQSNKH